MRGLRGTAPIMAVVAAVLTAPCAHGQVVEESRLLREAAARESQGDFEGAERVLRRLLEVSPTSSGGLFALERVLRAKGEPGDILPVVDRFLTGDPTASGVRYLKLRVLVELDSLGAVQPEAERWLRAESDSEGPYREVARVYERAFGPEPALEILRRGRVALGRQGAFAMEVGDVLAATGRTDEAVAEWARAVGDDGAQASAVSRRVAGLGPDTRSHGAALVAELARGPAVGRKRAGALIALELDLEDAALDLTRSVADDLTGRERAAFLSDIARRARDADHATLAAWAYRELGQEAASPSERRQFDQRLVEVSLADGDTAGALSAQARVVESFTPGSADRRRATATLIRLEASRESSNDLQAGLDAFREEFPQAPELDELASAVAGALLARGERDGAASVLDGIGGPRSSVQRGYLYLDAGEIEEGRRALVMAIGGLAPSVATEVIQFTGLLGRASPEGAELLARSGVLAHQGRGAAAGEAIQNGIDALPEEDRPMVLAEGARMAERGDAPDVAARVREKLLAEYPDAPEGAEAALSLARYHAARPGGLDTAIRLLEELVTSRPNAAVAPDARRELERLRRSEP